MGIEGSEGNLPEKDKKALQSETWQEVRDGMKEKRVVKHFTAENTVDNSYGWIWDQVVKEYLRSGYNAADSSLDIVVMGETYKTLKRPKVTVFYDAAGDTLFDVTNDRLQKEYEWLRNSGAMHVAENMDTREENDADGKGNSVVEQTEENPKTGEAPSAERAEKEESGSISDLTNKDAVVDLELPSLKTAEIKETNTQGGEAVKQWAEEKLKKEMESAKDKSFAEPIIGYLLERCKEDAGLAEDVVQEYKTWQKCFDFISHQARQQAKGNCVAVRDDVVYEWAEDYYHKDDKAEEEKKAKEAAERKKRAAEYNKKAAEQKGADKKNPKQATQKEEKAGKKPAEPQKTKKNPKEMEGQLDMLSMMGM